MSASASGNRPFASASPVMAFAPLAAQSAIRVGGAQNRRQIGFAFGGGSRRQNLFVCRRRSTVAMSTAPAQQLDLQVQASKKLDLPIMVTLHHLSSAVVNNTIFMVDFPLFCPSRIVYLLQFVSILYQPLTARVQLAILLLVGILQCFKIDQWKILNKVGSFMELEMVH